MDEEIRMKANLYYFSGTGNSLFIAKTIKATMEQEHELHNLEEKNIEGDIEVRIIPIQKFNQSKEIQDQSDVIGIIYPTYFLDAPNVVKNFAKKLLVSKNSYLFLYASYGETLGNALHNMNKLFGDNQVVENYEVVLPDNSIIFESKKEEIPKMLEVGETIIREHAKEIYRHKITAKSPYSFKYHLVAGGMKPLARKGLGFTRMKVDKDKCNGCGLCKSLCPMKNILLEEQSTLSKAPTFGKNCESCFSCLHYCPKEAITYQRMSKKKVNFQYRHPRISVKEMVDAQRE